MNLSILITGGGGYIGSHMVKMLCNQGYNVTVFDNFSRGFKNVILANDIVEGDLRNPDDLKSLFATRKFDVVMHFASLAYVDESCKFPRLYYENNVIGTHNLVNSMIDNGVDKIIFSSSCATYGIAETQILTEESPQQPINPYGRTKYIIEQMLEDYSKPYGLKSISLRYFNAAGCDPEGELGEQHIPETHLIPLVLKEALRIEHEKNSEGTQLVVFGDDFNTKDGTCIRDFIHVTDICSAHQAALERICNDTSALTEAYNLGNENGFSVKEIISECRVVTGKDIQYIISPRRRGDPPMLVGSSVKARQVLQWQPVFSELSTIIETAWKWIRQNHSRLT